MSEKTTDEVTSAQVVDINSTVDLDLDALPLRDRIRPWRVKLGDRIFEVEQPDAGLVMEVEQANTTQATLALIFDEQWPDIRPLLVGLEPDALLTLVRQYGQHFDLDAQGLMERATPNRAERRASARRPRRR